MLLTCGLSFIPAEQRHSSSSLVAPYRFTGGKLRKACNIHLISQRPPDSSTPAAQRHNISYELKIETFGPKIA